MLTVDPVTVAKDVFEIVKVNAPVLLEVAVRMKLGSPYVFVTSLKMIFGSTSVSYTHLTLPTSDLV